MRIFIDTAPLIYLIEGPPEYSEIVNTRLRQWIGTGAVLISSTITLTELLVEPLKQKDLRLTQKYRALIRDLLSEPLISMNEDIAVKAAEIRADYGFRTPDSIQLATAFEAGCDIFFTNDRRLGRYKDISVITVS